LRRLVHGLASFAIVPRRCAKMLTAPVRDGGRRWNLKCALCTYEMDTPQASAGLDPNCAECRHSGHAPTPSASTHAANGRAAEAAPGSFMLGPVPGAAHGNGASARQPSWPSARRPTPRPARVGPGLQIPPTGSPSSGTARTASGHIGLRVCSLCARTGRTSQHQLAHSGTARLDIVDRSVPDGRGNGCQYPPALHGSPT
jgi:hypothetical protein